LPVLSLVEFFIAFAFITNLRVRSSSRQSSSLLLKEGKTKNIAINIIEKTNIKTNHRAAEDLTIITVM